MNFSEYLKNFNNEKEAIEQLKIDITDAFNKNIDKITVSPNAQGHNSVITKGMEFKQSSLKRYVKYLVSDIVRQHTIDKICYPDQKNKPNPHPSVDIDKLLSGTVEWIPGTVFNPDMSLVECTNDGNKYVVNMTDWNINFYDHENFLFNKKLVEIIPFEYDRSLIHSTLEVSTGNMIAFNYLPDHIEDYIEDSFSNDSYDFSGRKWNKFLGEILLSANILRTPTHLGGQIFQDGDNIVSGGIVDLDHDSSPKYIGETHNDVWQTLIADKESLLKLFMNALKIDKQTAIKRIDTLIEEQSGVKFTITPGQYNVYYFPHMNNCLDENRTELFGDFCERKELEKVVNPDIILTKETIQPPFPLDNITLVSTEEKEAFQEKLLNQKNNKNDLSL